MPWFNPAGRASTKRLTQKHPASALAIEGRDSLSVNLAVLMHGNNYDLAAAGWRAAYGTLSREITSGGVGLRNSNNTLENFIETPTVSSTVNFALGMVFVPWDNTTGNQQLISGDNTLNSKRDYQCRFDTGAVGFLRFNTAVSTFSLGAGGQCALYEPFAALFVSEGATMRLLVRNQRGIDYSSGTITGTPAALGSTVHWLCRDLTYHGAASTTGVNGTLLLAAAWTRALTQEEMRRWIVDPFCLVRPSISKTLTYFIPTQKQAEPDRTYKPTAGKILRASVELVDFQRRPTKAYNKYNPYTNSLAFAFIAGAGLLEQVGIALWSPYARRGIPGSGEFFTWTTRGRAYRPLRLAGGGLNFGKTSPMWERTWTLFALANPRSTDGVSCLFSQRTTTVSPYNRLEFLVNSYGAYTNNPGYVQIKQLDVAANDGGGWTGDQSALVNGQFRAYAATGSVGASPTIYIDGGSKFMEGQYPGPGYYGSTDQYLRVGNTAEDNSSSANVAKCDIVMVFGWNRTLSAGEIADLSGKPEVMLTGVPAPKTYFLPPKRPTGKFLPAPRPSATKQPVGTPVINRHNPITKNLIGAFDPRTPYLIGHGARRVDVNNPMKTNVVPDTAWGRSRIPLGVGMYYNNSLSQYSYFKVQGLNVFPQTIMCLAALGYTTANMRLFGTYEATSQGFSFSPMSSETWRVFTNNTSLSAGGSDTYAHIHVATASSETSGTLSYWIDKDYQGSVTTNIGNSSTGIFIGATGGTPAVYLDGYIWLGAVWNRLLNDAEILSLSTNPWQIFEADY